MTLRSPLPESCFLTVPAEVTPELARSCPDKMNLLFQVQLLGRSIGDAESAFRLFLDLGKDVIAFDRAVLFWPQAPGAPLQPRASLGFGPAPSLIAHRDRLLPEDPRDRGRPFLLALDECPSPVLAATLSSLECSSLLSIPVYVGESVRGVVQFLRKAPPSFCEQEAHLARVFALAFEGIFEHLGEGDRRHEVAYLDRPTGLFNRRYVEQQLEREMDRARRNGESVSVLMLQLQGFEAFRSRHGHAAAEGLLQDVSRALGKVCRKSDTLARFGEESFSAILPKTAKSSLGIVAQRVFEGLEAATVPGPLGGEVSFSLCAVVYPEDAFSPESALEACREGIARAQSLPGRHYFQFPSPAPESRDEGIVDQGREEFLREPTLEIPDLLRLFTRLALDVVPADRVSVMAREGNELVIQVAVGFNGQEEVVRTTRIPMTQPTVSAWVAQNRHPLLVRSVRDAGELPRNHGATYRGDSFFSYPLMRGEDLFGLIHFSNRYDGQPFTQADVDRFAPVAGFFSRFLELAQGFGGLREGFLRESLFALVDQMESQIPGMAGHSGEVARIARETAIRVGLHEEEADRIWVSGRLHDVGGVGYHTNVLAEARALSPRERALTQRHPLLSWKFLEGLPLQGIDRDAILYHHEREDGSGYLHKGGQDTPTSAKILAVAEVYQALTSARPYRPPLSEQDALLYLESHQGSLFDPSVVAALREAMIGPASAAG